MIKWICDLCGREIERGIGPLRWRPTTLVCHETASLYDNEREDIVFKFHLHDECTDRATKAIQSTLADLKPGTIGI